MSATQTYRVLKPGIRQRAAGGWRVFEVGELIEVSAVAADALLPGGFIGPLDPHPRLAEVAPAPVPPEEPPAATAGQLADAGRCPDHPRYQGRGEPRRGCPACARLHAEAHAHEVLP